MDESGRIYDHWLVSTVCFTAVVHVVMIKLFIESVYWNWLSIGSGVCSLLLYYLMTLMINSQIVS